MATTDTNTRYCLIGAGACGLAVVKNFKERGIPFDCLEREADLKCELERERAKVRDLNQRLYGSKSEQRRHSEALPRPPLAGPVRPRGQQPGSRGHGRTPRPDLPVTQSTESTRPIRFLPGLGQPV